MKYTIKNPRKIVWIMRDFINSAHDLQYETWTLPTTPQPKDVNEFFEWMRNATESYGKRSVKMVSAGKYCAYISDEDETFRIGYDKEDIACNFYPGHSDFSVNIYSRCPMTRGFANITLALLHELGHIATNDSLEDWDATKRTERMKEISEQFKTRREINFAYFKMPDETAATDWAIDWLQDSEHRKMAKAFEKKFFACLEKN